MTKRIFALLLSAAMMLGLMAGCGNQQSSSAANAGKEDAAETSATASVGVKDLGSSLEVASAAESAVEAAAASNDPSLQLYSYDSNYGVGALTTGLPLTDQRPR